MEGPSQNCAPSEVLMFVNGRTTLDLAICPTHRQDTRQKPAIKVKRSLQKCFASMNT